MAHIQQNELIYGRFDRPRIYLDVSPLIGNRGGTAIAWGSLGDWHQIGGRFCTISASPMGDQLTIAPHQGDVGTIEFGSRGRSEPIRVSKCTLTSEMASTPVVRPGTQQPDPTVLRREFDVPVGDYAISSLNAICGRLSIRCYPLPDEHNTSTPNPDAYPIRIRKDTPYLFKIDRQSVRVLDLTDPKSYKRGNFARIRPMLSLPSLGLAMHTNYIVMRSSHDKKPSRGFSSDMHSVVITNSRGDTVARENMRGGYLIWRIPKDLELSGTSETFSANVTFQTHALCGPIEATVPIIVSKD